MTAPRVDHDDIATYIVGAVGQAGARELLDAPSRDPKPTVPR
jgi:hypothetical protein